jgi:3-hydroxyisobutyrate dehydrogenase
MVAAHGHAYLDCPVSGGGQAAAEGTLTAMVGAPAAEMARHHSVWQASFGKIFHVGEQAGAGSAVKLVNQTLYFSPSPPSPKPWPLPSAPEWRCRRCWR